MRQLIIARKDLNMSPGKLAAQVSHASMAFLSHMIQEGGLQKRVSLDTVKSGSLILTLKASYLDTLTPGTHQVTATFDDGSADTTIKILETPATPAPTDVPKTGDGADLGLWLTLMPADRSPEKSPPADQGAPGRDRGNPAARPKMVKGEIRFPDRVYDDGVPGGRGFLQFASSINMIMQAGFGLRFFDG